MLKNSQDFTKTLVDSVSANTLMKKRPSGRFFVIHTKKHTNKTSLAPLRLFRFGELEFKPSAGFSFLYVDLTSKTR